MPSGARMAGEMEERLLQRAQMPCISAGEIKVFLACALWTQFVDARRCSGLVAAESEAADMVS